MDAEGISKGRYLTDKDLVPYTQAAECDGIRINRDEKTLTTQSSKRMAAPEFLVTESEEQAEKQRLSTEGIVEGSRFWEKVKNARGTCNIESLPKKDVLWNTLRFLKLAKGPKTRSTVQVICHTIDEHLKNMIFASTTITPTMESATAQTVGKVVLHAYM